ncbi:MAG: hypothetical protein KC586_08360 [Myxococcales bacterium]|nr:hypothetical protein [Myxococcales bacterium]
MDGTACDTGNFCAWADACGGGTCSGTVTDCAPRGAFVPGTTNTTLRGGGGGGAFLQACPAGSVMVGVAGAVASGFYSGVLTQVATLCSTLDVSTGAVVLGAPVRVPPTGGAGGVTGSGAATATCPAGEVVVGFSGRSGSFVNNVALRCAPLTLTGDAMSGFAFSVGATSGGAAIGSGSGSAFGATDCAAGEVARGSVGRSGDVVDGFGLRCGTPQLDVVTTAPLVGNPGGGINRDDCPGGVPIGVTGTVASGFYSQAITRYTTQCGRIDVTADASGGWTVAVVPTGSVPSTGTRAIWSSTSGGPMSAACPANQVVVGLTGRAVARGASTLTLSCAPIAVTGDTVVGWTVTPGMAANATPVGSGAGTASPAYSCPDGTLASGFYVRSGEILDGIALRCAMPPINVVP